MGKTKKSLYNLLFSIVYKLLVMGIGLLIPRMFILQYGSEINGLQSSISQIFTYIALIEAGVGEASLQALYKPIANKDYSSANDILTATTKYYNKIGIIYFGLLFLLASFYPLVMQVESMSYFMVFLYIIIAGATTGVNFFFVAKIGIVINAMGDVYWTSIIQFFVYILTSISKIFCILQGYNIVVIQLCYFAVNMLYTLAIYVFAKKKYPWICFKQNPDYKAIEQKNSVLLHKISGIVFQNTDVVLLTFFCDLNVVSIYTVYKLVISSILSIVSIANGSVAFAFGQTFAVSKQQFCKMIDAYNVYYTAISYAVFTVTYLLYIPFIDLYTKGSDINYVDQWLPLLFVLMEVLTIGREAMMQTITVAGHFKKTQWRSIIESSINLICSVVFVYRLGIYGVLLGTIVALVYRTIDVNVYANKYILNRSSLGTMKIWVSNMIMMGMIIILMNNFIPVMVKDYFVFFMYGAVMLAVILPVFILVNSIVNVEEYKYAVSLLKRVLKKA